MDNNDKPSEVFIISLISHRSQKPRVEIKLGELRTQMSAAAAVDIAKNILHVAAGAYADAFIFNFVTEKLNQPKEVGAQIIGEFREYRDVLDREFQKEQEDGRR